MTGEIVAIITLLIIIVLQCIFIVMQKRDFNVIQSNLLDRIMSRDYETYIHGEVAKKYQNIPLTNDEFYAQEEEQGIPI